MLRTLNVDQLGTGMWIPVKDANGRAQERYRYLIQIGTGNVALNMGQFEHGGVMTSRTIRAAIIFEKKHVDEEIWEMAMQREPVSAARDWLKKHGIKVLDILPPRANANGIIRMVIRLSSASEQTFHQLAGLNGITTGKFIETDADREFFATIPLKEATREQAIEQSKFIGADGWGVVPA